MRHGWICGAIVCASAQGYAQAPPSPSPSGEETSSPLIARDAPPQRGFSDTPWEGAIDAQRYLVGPGDRMLVELWGMNDLTAEVVVNAEGRLLIPRVGVFNARGETLAKLRSTVEKRLRQVYPALHGGLTLSRPRTFLVHVTGAVLHPGSFPATPLSHVSSLVQAAGGPLPRGSTRRVELRRADDTGTRAVADLARYALLGDRAADPNLLDGDTVFVPLRALEVEVSGAVQRPGRYELVAGRDVSELLELAGGYTIEAAGGLPLRLSGRAEGDRVSVRSLASQGAGHTALRDGDRLHVPSLADLRRTVVVEGAVVGLEGTAALPRPSYLVDHHADSPTSAPRELAIPLAFVDGDGVRDLITKTGGLQPWADGAGAFVLRNGPDGARRRIGVDIPAVASGRAPDVEVKAGDTLVVPSRRDSVLIGGAVARPGLYTYSPELSAMDYLTLAGGTTRNADLGAARVLGHDGKSRPLKQAGAIEPGDAISVPEHVITAGEWVEITLLAGNVIVGAVTLAMSVPR